MVLPITENETREDERRLEKIFPLEQKPLLSITEGANYCPGSGFDGNDSCGDELDEGKELCASCQRIEDDHYQRQLWEADGEEPFVAYSHLTDRENF